jgi:hypothetical protein
VWFNILIPYENKLGMKMIEVSHNNIHYTFGVRVNASGIVLYLAYYNKGKQSFSYTDAWSTLKRDQIAIPDEVATKAKLKARGLTRVE